MSKKIIANRSYLLHWSHNPSYWNMTLNEFKKTIKYEYVHKINGRYYTVVCPCFDVDFNIVDCICNNETGDFYPISTDLLKAY